MIVWRVVEIRTELDQKNRDVVVSMQQHFFVLVLGKSRRHRDRIGQLIAQTRTDIVRAIQFAASVFAILDKTLEIEHHRSKFPCSFSPRALQLTSASSKKPIIVAKLCKGWHGLVELREALFCLLR